MIYAFCGLSGTGKSYLAHLFSEATGYPHLQSDVIRKELAGMGPLEQSASHPGSNIYTPAFSRQTYTTMIQRALEHPHAIVDATFTCQWQRNLLAGTGAPHWYILCQAPEEVIRQRIIQRQQRADNPSEADLDIYLLQKKSFEPFASHERVLRIDTYTQSPWKAVNDILQSISPEDDQKQHP
ncbi:AAA family ATPase [Desulfurispirillum indicum]|uniref:AAA family ATPase n=1 Tax=Desulfurispirillum indicum (strain ATCC BAA-1389 / DSM 22839 / S5) TaxID=653733 RepID=E6W4A7_DESIS|nr:AAA family ATPase [Desulfurispirillum indicum]ADU65881.1 hypothetical protein Selin_1146 [Desulfurispirillum indicum S5]UCZ57817.1 AAA family ATPase [Desulfurispirillum indicum]